MSRPSWSDSWMELAETVSRRSLCEGAQVGTAIVDKNNRIVATGYNGPPQGFNHGGKTCSAWCERQQTRGSDRPARYGLACPSIHSEANALMFADRRQYEGGTIYVTAVCCEDCSKLVANSGVEHVYMKVNDTDFEREIHKTVKFLIECGIKVSLVIASSQSADAVDWGELAKLSYKDERLRVVHA